MGRCQLAKGPELIAKRKANVRYLESKLNGLPGLRMPKVGPAGDHVYYVHVLDYDARAVGVSRGLFAKAVKAELPPTRLREDEGVLISEGYAKPLYLQPLFQTMVGYGSVQCPFRCPHYDGEVDYSPGICPNAEDAHYDRVILHELMRPPMTHDDLDDVAAAFHKVAEHRHELSDQAAMAH